MRIFLILTAFFSIFCAASAGEFEEIGIENLFLESECKLAKNSNIYLIFDLKNAKIHIKAKGASYKEFQAAMVKLWGAETPTAPQKLIKKSTFFKPKREKLKPVKKDEEAPPSLDIEALELKDMPARYRLVLDGGTNIYIRPEVKRALIGLPGEVFFYMKWYVVMPLQTVWNAVLNRPFSAIYIKLSGEDARALYWSFPEGTDCIVYLPR